MDVRDYLKIDDPIQRIETLSAEIVRRNNEIRELGSIRAAAMIEAYESRIPPKAIAKAGGFNMSRLRQIFKAADYRPPFNYRDNSVATQFKTDYINA